MFPADQMFIEAEMAYRRERMTGVRPRRERRFRRTRHGSAKTTAPRRSDHIKAA